MALLTLTRVTASIPNNGTYTPNCLLTGAFELTAVGNATILPPTMITDGTLWFLKIIFGTADPATRVVTFDSAYNMIVGEQELRGIGTGAMGWVFLYESGSVHVVKTIGM